jgi:hemerythrin
MNGSVRRIFLRLFQWRDTYTVYIPDVDLEHRALYRIADELHRAILGGAVPGKINAKLQELTAHIVEHFAHEENLMRETDYPAFDWHKRQHVHATRKTLDLAGRLRAGQPGAGLELLKFLDQWLSEHVGLTDKMMAAFLRNHEREHSTLAS